MIISFYVDLKEGNSSLIKFGSYDKLGFDGEDLDMFETKSIKTWDLNAPKFYLGKI